MRAHRLLTGGFVLAFTALGWAQSADAKPKPYSCDQWKARLATEAARTKLLPPIRFDQSAAQNIELNNIDGIEFTATCRDGRFQSLNAVARGRDDATQKRWTALQIALGKTFDPKLNDAQINSRIVDMTASAKKEFAESTSRGDRNARGDGLGDFGLYWMTVQIQGGRIGLSATLPNDDE